MPDRSGILLVDKPAGISSAEVVRRVKRALGVKKVGHLGTLDPFATGLLPIAIEEGSKIVPFLNQEGKAYSGTIRLGAATDTLDATGKTTETAPVPALDPARLEAAAAKFRGEIDQVPPMYSALKQGGVRLYELARRGVEVEREPRRVRIDSLWLSIESETLLGLEVECSKGTYVRSLARDLAAELGTVGHLASLRRTAFGAFRAADSIPLDALSAAAALPLLSPRAALGPVRTLAAPSRLEEQIRLGQQYALAELPPPRAADEIAAAVAPGDRLVAVLGASGRSWRILRVLAPPSPAEKPAVS
jgi:tRNA pseudouridine55 synthase